MKYDVFPMNISKHTWKFFVLKMNYSVLQGRGEGFFSFGLEMGSINFIFLLFNAGFLVTWKNELGSSCGLPRTYWIKMCKYICVYKYICINLDKCVYIYRGVNVCKYKNLLENNWEHPQVQLLSSERFWSVREGLDLSGVITLPCCI